MSQPELVADVAGDILLVEHGPVTRLTLNRPDRHNAINTPLGDELVDAFTTIGRDPSVHVIVLCGAGASFCSGDDRSEGGDARIPGVPWPNPYHSVHVEPFGVERHGFFQLQSLLRRIPQPVICEVHGYCMGSALELMLACDFAIADPATQFKAIINTSVFLPRYVGLKQAMRLIVANDFLSADEAGRLGMLTCVAAPGRLRVDVDELAGRLSALASEQYGYLGIVKDTINRTLFPAVEDDVRRQVLGFRLADFYSQTHPTD